MSKLYHKAVVERRGLRPNFSVTTKVKMTLCFRAKGKPGCKTIPDWLSVEFSLDAKQPRCYSIWVIPWIAEPALAVEALEIDGSVEGWITHLESLGFEDVVQVSCVEFFGVRADRDR